MIAAFKSRRPKHRPAPVPKTADPDIQIAYCWGLNLDEWKALTDFERKECRRTVTTAPKFGVAA